MLILSRAQITNSSNQNVKRMMILKDKWFINNLSLLIPQTKPY